MIFLIGIVMLFALMPAHAEPVTWDGTPIRIALTVGQERRITLPAPARWRALSVALEVTAFDRTLLLRAQSPFPITRMTLQEIDSGRILLLDLITSPDAGVAPIEIVRATLEPLPPDTVDPKVALTRFAAQQFYAPARLRTPLPGAARVGIATRAIPGLYRHGALTITPIAAWRYAGMILTACAVENRSSATVSWDPRQLRGTWLTATAQHTRLGPTGTRDAHTIAYLISELPPREAYP